MFKSFLVLGLATLLGASACTGGGDSSFVIANRSDYVLDEVRITEVNDPTWGPNLLPDVLYPGEDLVITNIDCGTYDVLVVDELGSDCELHNNDLCFDTDRWVIDNLTLDVCAFSPRKAPGSTPDAGTTAAQSAI